MSVMFVMVLTSHWLKSALKEEAAFRQEIFAVAVLIPVTFFLQLSLSMKGLMVATLILIPIVELLNSSIEATVDRISLEKHPLAKQAKDMASAAVLLSVILAFIIWALGLYSHFTLA